MEDIKERTGKIADNLERAFDWANDQDDEITKTSVGKALKSVSRSLTTIDRAVQERPSIAVFGQSQVGKSYLVQNLTKPTDEKFLKIKVDDNKPGVNFLTEMNPDGGKESTGLVTRFTTKETANPKSHPFSVQLFGQLDIAAILLNSFWSDLKDYDNILDDFSFNDSKQLLQKISTNEYQDDLDEYDIHYFVNYIYKNFSDTFLIRELKKIGYFKELIDLLGKIKYSDRWEVLQVFWGNNKFITELFKMLSEGLAELAFSKEVNVNLAALAPNKTTILDVARIRELFENIPNSENIEVLTKDNKLVSINRSIVSVLAKEVQLELANTFENDEERTFMNTSDVLDFPGSKSREKIPLKVFNSNSTDEKLQLLIRGKVSYLFDAYTNNLGVATLLYCMDDNPPEEKEAPNRLHKWVKKYVGENIEDRSNRLSKTLGILQKNHLNVNQVSPLLVVFTKFNQELNKVIPGKEASIETHDSKWLARFHENFVEFMSRPVDDKWIKNWTKQQQTFKFVFPVRDPMYSQATFEGYEIEKTETRIRPERKEAMNAIGISFRGSELVQDHILKPKKVWDELSNPNGTGVSYLSKHLKSSAHPEVTRTRFNFELNKINRELTSILKPYKVSGNIDDDLKKAKKESLRVFTSMVAIANRSDHALSQILNKMLMTDTEVWNIVYDSIFNTNEPLDSESNIDLQQSFKDLGIEITSETKQSEIMEGLRDLYEGLSDDEIRTLILDQFDFDINKIGQLIANKNDKSNNSSLAERIIGYWVDKMISLSLSDDVSDQLNDKQQESLRALVNEILKSRERLQLKTHLLNIISDIQTGAISMEDIELIANCSSTLLNNFIFSAGWSLSEEEDKPLNKTGQNIFSDYGKVFNIKNLNYKPKESKGIYFKEWRIGCKHIFEENVKFEYGIKETINTDHNKLLNDILVTLENDIEIE
ncbi:hypothetical protein CAP47_07105 [Psychroflexus sp. S27]|uniref:virulence factor SrfC family protein n=1 Tax=Psychroflexus sp. S27 TaxID=1982757 RepID=UPI000C29BFDD|nr:virulence factor SrfC family protein [Psychroflexus sp. S27]PJX22787.1 hypothetical protein CAP47_07105 [Psychroflexus sp. S27]